MPSANSSTVDCCFEEGCARDPQCYPACREILARVGEAIKAAETAGESECTCSSGNPENYEGPARDCPVHGEPEAPVCSHDRWSKFYEKCMDCGFAPEASASGAKEAPCEGCEHPDHGDDPCGSCPCGHSVPQPAPRRSPYAVAYELQDGSAFEVALPGDATVRADDGLLIIHHAQSPVKGLVQVKPWGDQ